MRSGHNNHALNFYRMQFNSVQIPQIFTSTIVHKTSPPVSVKTRLVCKPAFCATDLQYKAIYRERYRIDRGRLVMGQDENIMLSLTYWSITATALTDLRESLGGVSLGMVDGALALNCPSGWGGR